MTENAVVIMENTDTAEISIAKTGEDSMIRVRTEKYGSTAFTIRDGEKEYHLTAVVYEDEGGYPQLKIIPEE